MTKYVATINTPGHLPWDDDPPVFDTAAEAWEYLAEERKRAEDDAPEWSDHDCPDPNACGYSDELLNLQHMAREVPAYLQVGTVYGATPGYEGDHDLGLAYSVDAIEDDDLEVINGETLITKHKGPIYLDPETGEFSTDEEA